MDVKKGWREQLPVGSQDKIKKWAEIVVRQWHDEVKPDYIFLTETSAVPYGFVLKEAWRRAYEKEDMPRFQRIDPMYSLIERGNIKNYLTRALKEKPELVAVANRNVIAPVSKRVTKQNPRILVFDEGAVRDLSPNNVPLKQYSRDNLYLYDSQRSSENEEKERDHMGIHSTSLMHTMSFLDEVLRYRGDTPEIWGSQQAVPDVLYQTITKKGVSRMPTQKVDKSKNWDRDDSPRTYKNRFVGNIVKEPRQRKRAIAYINDLKQLGREAGEELHAQIERQQSLEQTLSATTAILGIGASIFFIGSNLTGNAIANMSSSATNIIGTILFLVGIAGAFFYFKGKKI